MARQALPLFQRGSPGSETLSGLSTAGYFALTGVVVRVEREGCGSYDPFTEGARARLGLPRAHGPGQVAKEFGFSKIIEPTSL